MVRSKNTNVLMPVQLQCLPHSLWRLNQFWLDEELGLRNCHYQHYHLKHSVLLHPITTITLRQTLSPPAANHMCYITASSLSVHELSLINDIFLFSCCHKRFSWTDKSQTQQLITEQLMIMNNMLQMSRCLLWTFSQLPSLTYIVLSITYRSPFF